MNVLLLGTYKKSPFIRLLVPLIAGILLQWYLQLESALLISTSIFLSIIYIAYSLLPKHIKFVLRWMQGCCIILFFIIAGALATYVHDIRHQQDWIGKKYDKEAFVTATLNEPLVDKQNSYKALASITAIQKENVFEKAKGEVLIYFSKDSSVAKLGYGSQIIFRKQLQEIKNSGNPAAFDYKRYCLFKDISHQVFLKQIDYVTLPDKNKDWCKEMLFDIRSSVLQIIEEYVPNAQEQGVAKALLIGYKDDLDKELVQSYSNTGVVHIIAISGLHVGMIYALIIWIFSPFKNKRWHKSIRFITVLIILWMFTLTAGAVPSILRSAVMFSFIAFGETLNKKANIYNMLAASAFFLLVYNPFYLWDVGFQLSYAAVLSIVSFRKPIYYLIDINNKILDKLWMLCSVTLSAQILTLPFILYYFHQFPLSFLLTNLIVVPLSCFILYGLIILILISKFVWLSTIIGKVISAFLWLMNHFIINIENLPYTILRNIQINFTQSVLLMLFIVSIAIWLMYKLPRYFIAGLTFLTAFIIINAFDIMKNRNHNRLVVYNIPKHKAIDVMETGNYIFLGDDIVKQDNFILNFHLKPARIFYRSDNAADVHNITISNNLIVSSNKKIIIVDSSFRFMYPSSTITVDEVIITGNPNIDVKKLMKGIHCNEIIFDSSNPAWEIQRWKKDCENLHLRFHSVPDDGAYETEL